LATRHRSIDGVLSLAVLPRSSDQYRRLSTGWVIAVWVVLTAVGWLLPGPRRMPRWLGWLYRVAAGAVVLAFALSQLSEWISDYRVVLSIRAFSLGILLLVVPSLWTVVRLIEETAAPYIEARRRMRWAVRLAAVFVVLGPLGLTVWQLTLKEPLNRYRTAPSGPGQAAGVCGSAACEAREL